MAEPAVPRCDYCSRQDVDDAWLSVELARVSPVDDSYNDEIDQADQQDQPPRPRP